MLRTVVPGCSVARSAWEQPVVRVEDRLVACGGEGAEQACLFGGRIGEDRKRLRCMGRHYHALEAPNGAVAECELGVILQTADRTHGRLQVDRGIDVTEQRVDVGPAAAGHCAPPSPSQAQQAVGAEERDTGLRRDCERISGSRRPERGRHGDEVVPAERPGVALVVQKLRQGLARDVRTPGGAEEAQDLAPEPAGPPRPPARPGNAARTLARERHLRWTTADAELGEQSGEERIVGLVVDDEARVHRRRADGHRANVPSGSPGRLEELDARAARERVRRAEPGDPRSDHGHRHRASR